MIVHCSQVSKSFDGGKTFAIRNLTVDIQEGEFIAVIGLSGAGKSTFLRLLNGTINADAGQLTVFGMDVKVLRGKDLVNLRKKIGFIFQQFNLVKSISVLENVLIGRIAYMPLWRAVLGLFPKNDCELAKKILASVGLEGKEHEKVKNLSGGQQQRVAFARALAQEPKLLLADEPMASLDPRLSELVIEMLAKINREQGITTIVNIHALDLAKKYAKRLLAFRQGTIIFDGSPIELSQEKLDAIYHLEEK